MTGPLATHTYPTKVAVTGAFGYTGKYIARRLLAQGKTVITLTGRPGQPAPELDGRVEAVPYNFDHSEALRASLSGVTTLYNTYWVRFSHGETSFDLAVANTHRLLQAAQEAGVRRIVHVSITNPSPDSPLPYFHGKAALEQAIQASGLSYAILRPTVIFGKEDILINNIAWLLRRFPIFAIPGSGTYRLQPVYVEDMAELAVQAGEEAESQVIDVVGPDIFTFNELVRLIAASIGSRARLIHLSPGLALFLSRLVGWVVGDVVLTPDEVAGLSMNLLVSSNRPTGRVHLADWLADNAALVGKHYASELRRHYQR
jgi:uncharacterized protein YbjT (DUF2867 family)